MWIPRSDRWKRTRRESAPAKRAFQSNDFVRRSAFFVECRFLDSRRASFDALVGFVGRRRFGTTRARLISSARRSSASSRFRLWLRMSLATTRTLPSVFIRDASFARRRFRCSSSTAREFRTFQNISTRDEVLLTCCPPAPDDLDTRTSNSLRGIDSDSLTARTFWGEVAVGSLKSAPAKKLERGEECHHSPGQYHQYLRRQRRQRRALEHIGPQRVVHRCQRQQPNERLYGVGKIRG